MKQHGLTILSAVDKAHIQDLDVVLRAIGDDIVNQTDIPFDDLSLLHYASWVVFPGGKPGPQLIFESNFDGEPADFLRQLASQAHAGLDKIYQYCPDYPRGGDIEAVCRYFEAHTVNTDTFYVSNGGYTREQVLQEERLREKVEAFLGAQNGKADRSTVRRSIQDFVTGDPDLAWARNPASLFTFWDRLRVRDIVIILLLLAGLLIPGMLIGWGMWVVLLLVIGVILYLTLRRKEDTDPSISSQPVEDAQPDPADVRELAKREDRRPQNHLASVTVVKPGVFRFALLKTVLAAVEFLGRQVFYKGSLSGIPSIHFARWAMINGGQHLLFLSNFDGSWEHYLGEFIDQASIGLTGVWSNSVNFPRTKNLVQEGAADEQRFKAYARRSQIYTQLWYSAYPFLSVANIRNNAAIREQLWGAMSDTDVDAWLRRF